MEEKKTIVVLQEDGSQKEAEVIAIFNLETTNRDYIMYTLNEIDENNMVRIYTSVLVEKDGVYGFEAIKNDEEWTSVKEAMKQMAKDGKIE